MLKKRKKDTLEFETPLKGLTFIKIDGGNTFFFCRGCFDKKPHKKAKKLTKYWMVRVS